MAEMWLSTADLYQDLGVSSDVDVIENRPRQRVIDDGEDTTGYILFGGRPRDGDQVSDEEHVPPPDLTNITSMVRMVKQAERLPSPTSPQQKRDKQTAQVEIITISKSKLNPNVTEFVPGQQKRSIVSPADTQSSSRLKNSDQDLIEDLTVNMDSIKEEDKDQIARILKEKYKSAKQDKTKRNVAINTLMKLYTSKSPSKCSNATSSVPGDHNEVQLLEPDYFLTDSIPRTNNTEVDPYAKQASISRVNKWLDSSSKDNSLPLLEDSRKASDEETPEDTTKSNKNNSTGTYNKGNSEEDSKKSSSFLRPSTSKPSTCKRYVPSKDMAKKLERLNKMAVEAEKDIINESVWDRAIREMRMLDEKKRLEMIKKRREEENPSSHRT